MVGAGPRGAVVVVVGVEETIVLGAGVVVDKVM